MQSTISTFPPYLSLSVWLPILFGVIILAVGRDSKAGFTRVLSLVGAIVSFLPTIPLFTQFSNTAHGPQFVEKAAWIERFNIQYYLVEEDGDADRISIAFAEAKKTKRPVAVLVADEYHGFN